ncbi:MAG: DNA-formamidopyrimidine glycosylase family protein [Nitriliruptoraceae bacterium]
MPELPDIEDYRAALEPRVIGARVHGVRITGVSLLRTYEPPVEAMRGRRILAVRRLGKRLVFGLEDELFVVLHLMIAGRLRWLEYGAKLPGRIGLAAIDLSAPDDPDRAGGTLAITEAGSKRRASLHLVTGEAAVAEHDRGGLEPIGADVADVAARLRLENRTLKRALTDPRRFSGIGNAFSDEILHAAGLSPVKRTARLTDDEVAALAHAMHEVLSAWIVRLRTATGAGFPAKVTASRPGFAVHGKHGQPCPVCGTEVQRISYADNETNYCPRCQTGGKLLADRSLSRLLKDDWPRTIDQLEGS